MVDFHDNTEEAEFRTEVRSFISDEFQPRRQQMREEARAAQMFDRPPTQREWEKQLAGRGWIAPAWPKQYGGAGLSVMQQFIFNEEMAEARAPRPGGIAIGMAGPTIITIGTDEQQEEHLPPILSGDSIWCQGYSEPGSGSDLASLQTRAVKDGDDFVINGQKIWTSGAHKSDWMILLARTDPTRRSIAASPTSSSTCTHPASRRDRWSIWLARTSSTKSFSRMCASLSATFWARSTAAGTAQ